MSSQDEKDFSKSFSSNLNINAKVFVPGLSSMAPQPVLDETRNVEEIDFIAETNANEVPEPKLKENNCETKNNEINTLPVEQNKTTSTESDGTGIVMPNKEFVNIVFIGHVDAGKSTIGGHLLYLTGMVDERDVEKNKKKAAEMNRESWYLSWALDLNDDERAKGKTVECGRAFFETTKKHFNLIDAPGHKSYVNHMITGSSQADVAILVISARIGEFEAGFEKGGQTQEHTVLVKTKGVKKLVVLINKMDDPSVEWNEERYESIRTKLIPFFKKTGFNPKTDVCFIPCSGYQGHYLLKKAPESVCNWYDGPTLIEYLDEMAPLERNISGPLRLTVLDTIRDMGLFVIGKIESGSLKKNQNVVVMPSEQQIEIIQITKDEEEVNVAIAGDQVKVKLKNADEDQISTGFVFCSLNSLCKVTNVFDAKVLFGDSEKIYSIGYSCVMHIHSLVKDVTIKKILFILDPKNPQTPKAKNPNFIKSGDLAIVRFEVNDGVICIENFKEFQQMGRFVLRRNTQTIGQGMVLKADIKK